jgi:hypothetical protein
MARDLSKSPFPGMDPYLEPYWSDVHQSLCTYSRDQLQKMLPPGLIARTEQRTIVESGFDEKRVIIPDVRVIEYGERAGSVATAPSPPANEPMLIENDEAITEGFVQVIDTRNNNRVLSVIEFASPANKVSSAGREMYRRKQDELLGGGVSLVEIDLVRSGQWNLFAPQHKVQRRRAGIFHVCITRGWDVTRSQVHAITLEEKLPTIHVPLRQTDNDVTLDLQSLMDLAYENGAYGYDVDYSRDPVPPLSEGDSRWAREWLKSRL